MSKIKCRNMSFAMTKPQIKAHTKDVTRRDRWRHAKPGMLLRPVDRVMGFKQGERPQPLIPGWVVRVLTVRREPLEDITQTDVMREGFPEMTPAEFVAMYRKHSKAVEVTRIEFEYVLIDSLTESPNAV